MKKLSLILAAVLVLSFSACGKDEAKTEEKPEVKTEQKADSPEGTQLPNQQIEIKDAKDLEDKINRFNELLDGDPEKEQLRAELEALFASVEQ